MCTMNPRKHVDHIPHSYIDGVEGLYIQLLQLTLTDQSIKPTRKDGMVVWVEVEDCCTCGILMK